MGEPRITYVCAVSKSYEPYLVRCLATIPASVPVITAWLGDPPSSEVAHPALRLVKPRDTQGPFRRGYLINVAARHVQTEFVMLGDADMLFPPRLFSDVESWLEPQRVVRFFVGRLGQSVSRRILGGELTWAESYSDLAGFPPPVEGGLLKRGLLAVARRTVHRVLPALAGPIEPADTEYHLIYGANNPCVYSRSDFESLRGYDERFTGWGGEDDDLTTRGRLRGIRNMRLPFVVGHLYHGDTNHEPGYKNVEGHRRNKVIGSQSERSVNATGWGDA